MDEIDERLIDRAHLLGVNLDEENIASAIEACRGAAIKGIATDKIDECLSQINSRLLDSNTVTDWLLDLRGIIAQL